MDSHFGYVENHGNLNAGPEKLVLFEMNIVVNFSEVPDAEKIHCGATF